MRQYSASPEYEEKSVIPSRICIAATDPGHFEGTIAIWGKAARQAPIPGVHLQSEEVPAFHLDASAVVKAEPTEMIRAFISDYETWNQYATATDERDAALGMAAAESANKVLMRKYCPPGCNHQPISFGSRSAHSSTQEEIVSADSAGEASLVRTRHTRVTGSLTMTDDYEYHLKRIDGRWYVVSVLYVDAEGKYECL